MSDLRTTALLDQWLAAVEALSASQYEQFWVSTVGRQGVWLVANKVYLTEWEKPKSEQDWDSLLRALDNLLVRIRQLGRPQFEASVTGVMIEILGDQKRLDEIPAIAEKTLSRWPADPDVQFNVQSVWGRRVAHQGRTDEGHNLLDNALSQPHGPQDHERLRCLLAASICVGADDLRYAEQARDLARSSSDLPDIQAARALGEYAVSVFQQHGGTAGAVAAFKTWDEAVRRYLATSNKEKIWRALFMMFAHVTTYLSELCRTGRPPEQMIDGKPFAVPARGFLMKEYTPELEALYRVDGEATVALMMGVYARAVGAGEVAADWAARAVDESRRIGAAYTQVVAVIEAIPDVVAAGRFEDAVEMGVFVGRGMVARNELNKHPGVNFEGLGVDLQLAFQNLPLEKRWSGDQFAVILSVLPTAMAIVRLSLTDPKAAEAAGRRIAAICREMADDVLGDQVLWRAAAELFEHSVEAEAKVTRIDAVSQTLEAGTERANAARLLGCVLATWHASPAEAMRYHLSAAEALIRWYPAGGTPHRLVFLPFIESYWRHIARHQRFALKSPDLTVAAIEAAAAVPETQRLHAILSGAANGFTIRGKSEALEQLRVALASSWVRT